MLTPLLHLVLLAQALFLFRHVLFSTRYVIPWDLPGYHLPLAHYLASSLREGRLPLWDPYTYCGMPFYGNVQAQVFYPPMWISVWTANWLGPNKLQNILEWQVVVHVFLGGVCCFWFLRNVGLQPGAALFGGILYESGCFFIMHPQHLGAVSAAAWMPLSWMAVVALAERFSWRWLVMLAVSSAMAVLAGFPAVGGVVLITSGLLALALVATREAPPRLLLYCAGGMVWAAALAAIQLIPSAHLTSFSEVRFRAGWEFGPGGIPVSALITLVVPNYHGIFSLPMEKLPPLPEFLYLYGSLAGVILFVCAVWRLVRPGRDRYGVAIVIVTGACLLWSFGDNTPFGHILRALPKSIRAPLVPQYAVTALSLGFAALAAMGANRWVAPRGWPAMAVLVTIAAADVAYVASGTRYNALPRQDYPVSDDRQFEGATGILPLVRERVHSTFPPDRIDAMRASWFWANSGPMYRIPSAAGNEPFALERYMAVRRLFAEGPYWERFLDVSRPDSPLVDLLNVRHILIYAALPPPQAPGLRLTGAADNHAVYENISALPRFFLVGRAIRVPSLEAARSALADPSFAPATGVIVEEPVELPAVPAPGYPPVRVLRYEPERVELETDSPAAAILVSSEAAFPGWRALLDGAENRILTVNAGFRGMRVPAGRHRITWVFEPAPLLWGAAVSLAALALLWPAYRRRNRR